MQRKDKGAGSSGFMTDVLKLASGTALGQVVVLAMSPIITRMYGPTDFGTLAVFASVTAIVQAISCLRYEKALLLPANKDEAAPILWICFGAVLAVSSLSAVVLFFGAELIAGFLNAPEISPYLWFAPIYIACGGIFLALTHWHMRSGRFGQISLSRVASDVTSTSVQLGAGYGSYASGGTLIGALVTGRVVATITLIVQAWRRDRFLILRGFSAKDMLAALDRHRKFPLFGTWSALLSALSWQAPVLLLTFFFLPPVVGYYALGFRVLYAPLNMVGDAISQVFFQRTARAVGEGALGRTVEDTFRWLVTISLVPMLILGIAGRDLYAAVFGGEWSEAGSYAQILALWLFLWFVSGPLSAIFSVLEAQKAQFLWNVVAFVTRVVSLGIGGYLGSPRLALILFAATGVCVYAYKVSITLRLADVSVYWGYRLIGVRMLRFLPMGAVLVGAVLQGFPSWMILVLSCGLIAFHVAANRREIFATHIDGTESAAEAI